MCTAATAGVLMCNSLKSQQFPLFTNISRSGILAIAT